jgi:release factor glutamine methyltransferase
MGEEASGSDGPAFRLRLDDVASADGAARFAELVTRRLNGEPLQYVLGRWGFRTLDLLVDRRVLIPRPETEQVVEAALAELDRLTRDLHASNRRRRVNVIDLGCGSGAVGLSIAAERHGVDVWCVDASAGAVAVTERNLAGVSLTDASLTTLEGSWFEPLPSHLAQAVDMIVANPPYVAAIDPLPPEVAEWEPAVALVAGPTGMEAIDHIVGHAPEWLTSTGVLVCEIGETQAAFASAAAQRAGFVDVEVRQDLAGRDRMVIARWL